MRVTLSSLATLSNKPYGRTYGSRRVLLAAEPGVPGIRTIRFLCFTIPSAIPVTFEPSGLDDYESQTN